MSDEKKKSGIWTVKINVRYVCIVVVVALLLITLAGVVGYNTAPSHSTITVTNTVTTTMSVYTSLSGNYTLIPSSSQNGLVIGFSASDILIYAVAFVGLILLASVIMRQSRY